MATIEITGRTVQVKSDIKLADIEVIKAYNPGALVLKEQNDDGKFVEKFRIGTGSGNGSLSAFGATFGDMPTSNGGALITIQVPEGVENVPEYVKGKFAAAVLTLNEIEAQIPAGVEAAKAKSDELDSVITVA